MKPELPLRDIHLPEAIGWWPPAPGWWILLVAGSVLLVWLYRLYRNTQQQRKFKRTVEQRLQAADAAFQQHRDARRLAQELSILLRRVALSIAPRSEVAGQTGERWLQQLDELARTRLFNTDTGRQLISAPYQPAAQIDAEGLIHISRQWIRRIKPRQVSHADI